MSRPDLKTIQNSALWAAYGDALGFITELADARWVKKRAGVSEVVKTVPWRRRIGGRFGPTVELPSGCYSDDTQLRLSTGRSVLASGQFDVEVFAKIELPVWTSYSLGAGRSSKVAATQLARRDVNWFSNFFEQKDVQYINGGGNGAAMRIQPHVWASHNLQDPNSYIPDVIRNAVCTHGHPRGILGAVFHAMCVAYACLKRQIPGPDYWQKSVDFFSLIPDIIKQDADLCAFWATTWEGETGTSIEKAFEIVKWECMKDLEISTTLNLEPTKHSYEQLVKRLGGLSPASRGSGIKTAVIASILSWMYTEEDPNSALTASANLLSSDTDTIATMAGAILGCTANEPPTNDLQDRPYILSEAARLYDIGQGNTEDSFNYPDILGWKPPRSQLDSIGSTETGVVLSGLAITEPVGNSYTGQEKDNYFWQWMKLDFGQTILVKQRKKLAKTPANNIPVQQAPSLSSRTDIDAALKHSPKSELDMFSKNHYEDVKRTRVTEREKTIEQLTKEAIASGFDATTIGKHLIELSMREKAIELSIAYASILSKAISTRVKSRRQ